MGDLSELALRTSYHKGRDDIAADFYMPCMRRASEYDRAVGYFRSTAFIIAWPALRDFVERGGRIRLLCSHVLAPEDIEALHQGYAARLDEILSARFLEEVRSLLRDDQLRAPSRILAALVARGTLDLQVAVLLPSDVPSAKGRLFHDKLGIFRDALQHVVIFKGSMNETWTGLSADGNLESVDVAASWMGERDKERAETEESYFRELWANEYPALQVRPFPDVARSELEQAADPDWESSLQRQLSASMPSPISEIHGRKLHPHQVDGLSAWMANGRRGILQFATGSGKTFTAIAAIRDALTRNEVVLIVVPDQVLFAQWAKELETFTSDLEVRTLRAGAGYSAWRDSLRAWTAPGEQQRLVLATVQTAAGDDFRTRLSGGRHLFLVADEVHRLGSPHHSQLLNETLFGPRLGLSATPERAGDPVGTEKLLAFFGGILTPAYTLGDAIRDGVLTKYFYRPHTLDLSDEEAIEWRAASADIARTRARLLSGDQSPGLSEKIFRLLLARARVVKSAAAKIPLAVSVLTTEYKRGQRWIIYCDDLRQLQEVSGALLSAGVKNMPFHSQMEGDRAETLRWLERRGGVVVAIKCLDEGVDIPSVTHALILASSKNPREFVQRRGRVLRTAPNKPLAYIHDTVVLPPSGDADEIAGDPITVGELARAVEFARHADNAGAASDLAQIAIDLGLSWATIAKQGIEDADD